MDDEPAWGRGGAKPPPWRAEPGRSVFANPWVEVIEQPATAPTGRRVTYGVLRFRNLAVGVLPIHADGTVVLVGQQRFPLAAYSWEMPEGGAPFDEDPLEGARRELAEEARLQAAVWRPALALELSNSISDERARTWLAWDLAPAEGAPDDTEVLTLARVPFRSLLAEAAAGRVRDAMTVATALRAYHMAREGELPPDLARAMLG